MDTAAASAYEAATEETYTNRKSPLPRSQRRGCPGRGEQGGAPWRKDGRKVGINLVKYGREERGYKGAPGKGTVRGPEAGRVGDSTQRKGRIQGNERRERIR